MVKYIGLSFSSINLKFKLMYMPVAINLDVTLVRFLVDAIFFYGFIAGCCEFIESVTHYS